MSQRRSFCLSFPALIAVIVGFLTVGAAPSYAKGKIHIVLIVSTTDPETKVANLIWKERIEGALSGEIDGGYLSAFGGDPATKLGGLGKYDVETYRVLVGDDARRDNILRVCREVSANAGPRDAIAVFMVSHGGIVKDAINGGYRHNLFPMATKTTQGDSIERSEIMKALKSHEHRLVVLATDSCSSLTLKSMRPLSSPCAPCAPAPRAFLPKRDCYLKKFLLEAEGEVDVNSTDWQEVAEFWENIPSNSSYENLMEPAPCSPVVPLPIPPGSEGEVGINSADYEKVAKNLAGDARAGTRFSNAFVNFATNGLYLDAELNPNDFYQLLSLELGREVASFNELMETHCKQTLTSFNDDGLRIRNDRFTLDDQIRISNNRFKAMEDKRGEFPEQ